MVQGKQKFQARKLAARGQGSGKQAGLRKGGKCPRSALGCTRTRLGLAKTRRAPSWSRRYARRLKCPGLAFCVAMPCSLSPPTMHALPCHMPLLPSAPGTNRVPLPQPLTKGQAAWPPPAYPSHTNDLFPRMSLCGCSPRKYILGTASREH